MRRIPLKRHPLFSADAIPAESRAIIEHFDRIIADVLLLSGKHRVQLGGAIRRCLAGNLVPAPYAAPVFSNSHFCAGPPHFKYL